MKKTYILLLEFEAEIKERFRTNNRKKKKYLNKLLREFLKNDQVILSIYRLWLMSDLGSDNHIYEIDRNLSILETRDELEIIKPVIRILPDDAKEHFHKIFSKDNDSIYQYFESLFGLFGNLKVRKANFLEKGK